MKHLVTASCLILLLAGCANLDSRPDESSAPYDDAQSRALHADLIREMIAQGRHYAALAHLEELEKKEGPRDELRLLRAQVLSKLERRQEAEHIFKSLLRGPYEGDARHGLGLLYADQDPAASLDYLAAAARLKPASATIRNDYGYALLLAGSFGAAKLQLATAYELEPGVERNRNNYLLALLLLQDEREAKRVIAASGAPSETVAKLRKRAKEWPKPGGTVAQPKKKKPERVAAPAASTPKPATKPASQPAPRPPRQIGVIP
jgi:Flp pilus assembly protein TadD